MPEPLADGDHVVAKYAFFLRTDAPDGGAQVRWSSSPSDGLRYHETPVECAAMRAGFGGVTAVYDGRNR